MSKVILVIPARFGSTRLPAKPLAEIHGKPMMQWVYERASQARGIDRILVATDDERIQKGVNRFGGECLLTSESLASGTERVAAVAEQIEGEIFVNVQGDEPLVDPLAIEKAVEQVQSGRFPMGTVASPLRSLEELKNPSVVKVILDSEGRAVYFSRLPIPYSRGSLPLPGEAFACKKHLGLYAYRKDLLLSWRHLPASTMEKAEVLEQLRAIESGISIGVAEVDCESIGVDTPEDLEKVRQILV